MTPNDNIPENEAVNADQVPKQPPENEALNADQFPPTEPPAADPCVPGSKVRFVQINNRPLRYVVADCLKVAQEANTPPTLFQQGNMLVRVRSDGDDIVLEPIVIDSLRGFLERAATFGKLYYKDDEPKTSYCPLPLDYVRDILALPGWPKKVFPPITGIARCPFFTADGQLVSEPGYHANSKIWLHLAPDLVVNPVPLVPSTEELKSARSWIVDELLGDFPFQTDADKANAVAYVLTPFLREMVRGPIPLGLLEAPAAGTGKGLLADAIAMPSLGMRLETIPQRNNDEEWRKAITAKLIELPLYILFDNLTGTLRSAALEAALTSENWSDRFLGETRMVRIKIRTIWLATANNLQIAGDLFRRVVWIRLDAKMERPEDRKPSEFKHPELLPWAKANRGKLIWAALTIIQAWIARGKVPGTEIMGSYESWTATLGGILKTIEVNDFLINLEKNRVTSDDELLQLGNLFEAWEKKFEDEDLSVSQLYELVAANDNLLPFVMEPETPQGRKVRLGKYLAKHRDRTVGHYQLVSLPPDKRSGCLRYRLVKQKDKQQETFQTETHQNGSSPSTQQDELPTNHRVCATGDYVDEQETTEADDTEEAEQDIPPLVDLCRSWWLAVGTKELADAELTQAFAKRGLVAGTTLDEQHRECRALLSELVGQAIDIFRIEKARFMIAPDGTRYPGYRLRVVDGEIPPPTNSNTDEAR